MKNALCVIQEAGNVGLEQRCAGAASTFSGKLTNLQVDNTNLPGPRRPWSEAPGRHVASTASSPSGRMSAQAVKAVANTGAKLTSSPPSTSTATWRRTSWTARSCSRSTSSRTLQGYLGVTAVYLKNLNGIDIGGGQPMLTGPAIITKDNAAAVLKFAEGGTR